MDELAAANALWPGFVFREDQAGHGQHTRSHRGRLLGDAKNRGTVPASGRSQHLPRYCEAGNGAEALAAVQKNKVDLILCDINMPVMDGMEFVKQLSGVENAKGVPVVMITTEGSEGTRGAGALGRGSRLHSQAVHARNRSKNTCCRCWRAKKMNPSNSATGSAHWAASAGCRLCSWRCRKYSNSCWPARSKSLRNRRRRWPRDHRHGGPGGTVVRRSDGALQHQVGRTHGLAHARRRPRKSGRKCGTRWEKSATWSPATSRTRSAGLGDGCMLSVPTVITGAEYNLHSLVNDEMHTVLLFEGEPVVLSLEIHN